MADLSKLSENILASFKAIAAGDGKDKNIIDSAQEYNELGKLLSNCETQDDYDYILGLKVSYQKKFEANANSIAKEFYQIADDNSGNLSMIQMSNLLSRKVNADNIVAILNAYANSDIRKNDSSIIDTVTSETGASAIEQRKVLTKIIDLLCQAARNAGVSESDIASAKNDFITSMEKEFGAHFRRTNPKDMENAIDFLRSAILAKQNAISDVDEDAAMQSVAKGYQEENTVASKKFEKARKEEGWTAKTGDWVCGLFGCNTEDELRKKLGDNAIKVEKLVQAVNSGNKEEFKRIYKELFGIEFDANKVAAAEEYAEKFNAAQSLNSMSRAMDEVLAQKDNLDYQGLINLLKEKFQYDDATINQILTQYSQELNQPIETDEQKRAILEYFLTSTKENCTSQLKFLLEGETLEQMASKAELLAKAAYGKNDITKDVTQFNENMVMTEMITDAAFEVAGTIALQFVPGLGQAAAVKLAASAAKWGAKGAKVVKWAQRAEKGFQTTNKFLQGQKFTSKYAQKGMQVGTQMLNAGVATATVEATSGKDLETIVKKTIMNMSFAGVGATSSMIAPKLVQSLGISNQLATEIAEELINAAGSYGVCSAAGDEYGSTDFWTDMATGIIMSRIAHVKGGKGEPNGKKPAIQEETHPAEIQRQKEVKEITATEESYNKYLDEKFGNNPILANARQTLEKINKEFGVKILLPDNMSEVGGTMKQIYQDLSLYRDYAKRAGASANFPTHIDFADPALARQGIVAGYDEITNYIAVRDLTIDDIKMTLRHELAHANDGKILTTDFPSSLDPHKFADELLEGGVEAKHVSYAFVNKQEFIAVAAEGNIRNYSPELKQALEEMGMPRWMLDMDSPRTIGYKPTAADRQKMNDYVAMQKSRNERLKEISGMHGQEEIINGILPPDSKMTIEQGITDLKELNEALECMRTPFDTHEIIEARKKSLMAGRLKINSKSKILRKDPITASILNDAAISIQKATKERKLVIVAGGAASGKSTYLTHNCYDSEHGYFLADADLIKTKLPGYNKYGASFVHTPSASLVRAELHIAIEQGCNIAYPTVGKKSIEEAIEIAQQAGYSDIKIVYCNIPAEIRAQRAVNRYLNEPEHRFVDPYYILKEEDIFNSLQELCKNLNIELVTT